jgi:flagellar motor switch protein FliN/FliY
MSKSPQINKFIEFFNSNASGVLSTITNQPVNFELNDYSPFNFDVLSQLIEIPCILISMSFSGDQNFHLQMIMDKKSVAVLSDLMMLGDGDVEYNPEDHNDAMKEMVNQILGSMTAEFSGDGINLVGTVLEAELTDMEIQRDFMVDNNLANLEFSLLGKNFIAFLVFDAQAESSIDIAVVSDEPAYDSPALKSSPQNDKQEDPVRVSRAQFSEFEQVRPSSGKNINIDLLLDVVLPVTVELGRKDMKIKEVLEIGQGSVVELDKLAGEMVDLLINGKKFAVGEVMVADENYAVRIVNLVSREERIKSLGSE